VIVSYRLSFLIPISKVGENMKRAQKRDAVLHEKLYFRSKLATSDTPPEGKKCTMEPKNPLSDVVEMTVNEIVNGIK